MYYDYTIHLKVGNLNSTFQLTVYIKWLPSSRVLLLFVADKNASHAQ